MSFVALALGLSMLFPPQDVLQVDVHKRRPSKIVAQLQRAIGLIPTGVEVVADDERGTITFKGADKDIKFLDQTVKLFDVEPLKVRVEYSVESPLDKVAYDGSVLVGSNTAYSFSESDSGVKVVITPRVNDDGSVTVAASYSFEKHEVSVIARAKPGEWLQLPAPHGKDEKALKGTPKVKIKVTLPSK